MTEPTLTWNGAVAACVFLGMLVHWMWVANRCRRHYTFVSYFKKRWMKLAAAGAVGVAGVFFNADLAAVLRLEDARLLVAFGWGVVGNVVCDAAGGAAVKYMKGLKR